MAGQRPKTSIADRLETVIDALIEQAQKLPRELYKSLTWDRGKETADHRRFSLATEVKVYFCDPQQPWQRGSNENTNGLLRQYFPKGMDLSDIHQNKLNAIARRLNERPRKTLGFETPAERFANALRRSIESATQTRQYAGSRAVTQNGGSGHPLRHGTDATVE